MKVVSVVYEDSNGNIWDVEKVSLPKKKGVYSFYTAYCRDLHISFRENLKRDLIKKIKNHKN
jgi:hypothetical protein